MTPGLPRRAARLAALVLSLGTLVATPPFVPRLSALDPARAISQYVHETWQTEQGLPQNSVWAITQSVDGYLWLGTQEGLVRFDGARFTVFDARNQPAMGQSDIQSLDRDPQGGVWVGSIGGGVLHFRGGQMKRYASPPGVAADIVRAVRVDRRGRVFVGTYGAGLLRIEGDRLVQVEPGDTLLRQRVRVIREDAQGVLWVGTDGGLARIADDGKAGWLGVAEGLPRDSVVALAAARDGSMWVGTAGGLSRVQDGRVVATLGTKDGLGHESVLSLLEDRDGTLWIGTQGGISRVRAGRVDAVAKGEDLSDNTVASLYEDADGSVWAGTSGGGLNRFKDGSFTPLTTREGLPNDFVRVVTEDAAGRLWVGTKGGLTRLRPGPAQHWTAKDGLGHDYVRSVLLDRAGVLWVGTEIGLVRMVDGRFEPVDDGGRLGDVSVRGLLEDARGRMWIGTFGRGVHVYEGGRLSTWDMKRGLSSDAACALADDGAGGVLVATFGGGLNRIAADGTVTVTRKADGLASDNLLSLLRDADGTVWVGSRGSGLSRLRDGRVRTITAAEGLFENTFHQIVDDARGNLWMSSNKGLFRVSRHDLDAFLDGRAPRVDSVVYGTADGMKTAECNGGSQFSGCRTRDGALWFPTIRGLVRVDPDRTFAVRPAPPVHVEEVLVDGRLLAAPHGARLPPGTQALEVHYTAPGLRTPARMRFRYRLDGFDHDWVDAGPRRTAYYTNLPPGDYRFRVGAADGDGPWSTEGATLAFGVEPRLHQRTSIRLLGLGLLGSALYGAYRLRVWRLQARERVLEAQVRERTVQLEAAVRQAEDASRAKSAFLANMSHELRTPLNGVLGFAQLMARRPGRDEEDRRGFDVILKSGEHLLSLINDVLSLSKIEAGRVRLEERAFALLPLVQGTLELLRVRADVKGLRLREEVAPEGLPALVLGDEGRVRQILLNLLSNAVKFTEKGEVTLRAAWSDGRATFEVEDTGPGIAAHELGQLFAPFAQAEAGRQAREGTGLGLALSRDLARLMGGDLTLESEPGRGTRARLSVMLPQASGAATSAARPGRVVGLAPGQERLRILVADDVALNRTVLRGLLESVGFEVAEAASGEEAVETWRRFRPHLVWMDKRMPGLDGLGATRLIREEERAQGLSPTQIVALSASALEHERGEILAAGCDEFVAKPFREETIFGVLRDRLGVRFALEDEPPPVAPRPRPEAAPTGRRRVLVVDDDAICREVAEELLRGHGVGVRSVASGEDALHALRAEPYDLVLMDLHMPGLGGVETARRIRGDARLRHLPLVVMSAESVDDDPALVAEAGMDDHLSKPVEPESLRALLGRWLARPPGA
jgi:signal transduction histidine kinase/ligand-binding sensor domain-containing protein/CheY-like chemotaxis protein